MAKLIYVTNVSLDGYIEDESGDFDFGGPDDDVFAYTTDLVRSVGTFFYGRRLYETMAVWETDAALAAQSDLRADFATGGAARNAHRASFLGGSSSRQRTGDQARSGRHGMGAGGPL